MAISDPTRKLLWGRAGNRCAICRQELVISGKGVDKESIIGQECHIVARETDEARGISDLTAQQRDEYENLILLCNVHHKQIDDQATEFSVERLKTIKIQHERWVRTSLDLLNGSTTSTGDQSQSDDLLIVSPFSRISTIQEGFKVRKESDGSIIEVLAAHAGHVDKNGKFLGDGWGFSITNNSQLSTRINRIFVNVLTTERLHDVKLAYSGGAGGGAENNLYLCELLPIIGLFECRYLSDNYDYVKITGNDLEYFEIYFVDRSFENRLYSVQLRIDYTLGLGEHSINLDPILLAFIEDWPAIYTLSKADHSDSHE